MAGVTVRVLHSPFQDISGSVIGVSGFGLSCRIAHLYELVLNIIVIGFRCLTFFPLGFDVSLGSIAHLPALRCKTAYHITQMLWSLNTNLPRNKPVSAIRRERHCLVITFSSISAMSSQLSYFGV